MYVSAVVAVCLWVGSQAAPALDEITHLPGLNHDIAFKHYSGYLSGDTGKHLHYWFVESSRDPVGDPVVLWMNGGPGCSSMEGLLAELGPYLINPDGKTLKKNPYAWNTMANMLFLEAPACVGFSYDDHVPIQCSTGDDETSLSNYLALQDFFTNKFPEYRNNSLFITGESYAGIYVPTLAVRVLKGKEKFPINLQGYAIGNGISSNDLNDDSRVFFAYYHGLLGDDLWDRLVDHCCTGGRASRQTCNFHNSTSPKCVVELFSALTIVFSGELNRYNMYDKCSHTTGGKFSRYQADLSNVMRRYGFNDTMVMEAKIKYNVNSDPPCLNATDIRTYLNTPEVRKALHIPTQVQTFEICNDLFHKIYEKEYTTMKPQYEYLTSRVRGLVYNGDIDMACNFLGDQWFVESLGLQVTEERRMWFQGGQVGGFVKRFASLDLLTVLGAGHMVPEDKPAPALKMITSFLFQKPY
ncbi:Lysosomal protective protein [Chionoecetes opilio]|uniref:Carboxypeptidase n=1 Tax=Chionoecetes opilio TaxID=41210 RepID=A0A8J5CR49_CHIOP|nr:Lysosomal protective protein [Chionoecetes opilio]